METFETGVNCAWTGHKFRANERGMKCLNPNCPRVMKISAWNERRRCFCGSTNAVEAIAFSSINPVQTQANIEQIHLTFTDIENSRIETFEAGVKCPYTMHTFASGERGMKCLNPSCQRVMTISAWNEKRHCFCRSTDAVEAIATTSHPTNLTINRQVTRIPIDWRDTTPANTSTSSTNPINLGNTNTHIGQFSTSNQTNINTNISNNTNNPSTNSSNLSLKLLKLVGVGAFLLFVTYTTPLKNLINPLFWQSLVSQEKFQVFKSNRKSPDKFLQDYYSLINNREYSTAWNRLSANFKNNKLVNEAGYTSYTNYWKTIERVEVLDTNIELNTEENARVYVQARYFIKDKNKSVDEAHRLFLVWDKKNSSWLIDSPRNLETLLRKVPKITNSSQLRALNRQIYNKINPAWTNRSSLTQDWTYRVGVVADGTVVGYEALSKEANYAAGQTPLPNLLYGSDKRDGIINEPIALFRVTFRKQGLLEVSPWL
ncbi:hypothetical protein DSM106972_098500 [Dulcicalothrix desertica PCC 7102]|uniref:Uncharacterized protein n=1 Tax=Dulcicalothrix desertica PCC 7102 TaxID=232991 RepID=A0A3S1AI09_9CYAN|nr:hypothetical protein [Dulcicalothrix desertica]RUS92676.1 hypothetical protein DSM106972_098500 [Dulcicalothrix desertica PCC 7102]TWH61379.1 hypothetical protein CAL7102_00935 [Dulcicalothrix desertica PCC 7102]